MANTDYPVGHALAVQHWSKELLVEALSQTSLQQFMSKRSDNIFQIKSETSKEAGDTITFGLRMQLTGAGVSGDNTLEGNEEALTTFSETVIVDQLRHAVRSGGKMSEQRVPFSVRAEARDGLSDWWADRIDTSGFNQLGGAAHLNSHDVRFFGMQVTVDPITAGDTDHYYLPEAQTTEAGVASKSASAVFKLGLLDAVVAQAKTISPLIRPIKIRGQDHFVCFLHPRQVQDLREDTGTNNWADIQKAAMQGGQVSQNPIFTGALGMYNNVILFENTRVPTANTTPSDGGMRRAIFAGAQAGCMAFGRGSSLSTMSWAEKLFDFDNQLGVKAGMIWGLLKTRFNSKDYGTIIIPTYTKTA